VREILVMSTSTGKKYLLFGLDAEDMSSFSIQLYITKTGKRYVDWMSSLSLGFCTFMGGDLWLHNSDTVPRCNLFNEQKDCKVGIVTNEEPTKVKLFDSLGIHTNGEWEVTEVIIPHTLNYPNGMYSKIPVEQFKKRDGVWHARFLRNMQTNQNATSVIDALRGEVLRGYEAYFVLKNVNNSAGEQVKLFKVDINSSSSRI